MRYDASMPEDQVAILKDRIGVVLRWAVLVALALLPAMRAPVGVAASVPLMLAGLWNIFLSMLAVVERRFAFQELLTIGGDVLLALVLFDTTGSVLGPWVWAGLLPVLSGALLFRMTGAILIALGMTVVYSLLALVDVPPAQMAGHMLAPAIIFLLSGLATGFAAEKFQAGFKEEEPETNPAEDVQQQEDRRVKTLVDIVSTLSGSMLYDQILDLALDVSEKVLLSSGEAVSRLVGAVLLFQADGLRVVASRRLAASDLERSLPGNSGILKEVSESGEAKIIGEPGADPELIRLAGIQTCRAVYCMPLRAGLDLYGVMLFGHVEPDYFTPARVEMLSVVANQVMVSLENARLYETLGVEKQRIVGIQEQAQQQLARNLHDGPTQSVAAIAMRVNLIRRMVGEDAEAAGKELLKLEELARRTTMEMRHMLFSLHPKSLEHGGLVTALEDLVQQTKETYDEAVMLKADSEAIKRMDLGRQGVLFHIAAEAITNARKHARAAKIGVRLGLAEQDIAVLEIADDGVGFDLQEAERVRKQKGGLGLAMLRERVELINGRLQIESEQGQGTRVRVWAPLDEEAAERLRHGSGA